MKRSLIQWGQGAEAAHLPVAKEQSEGDQAWLRHTAPKHMPELAYSNSGPHLKITVTSQQHKPATYQPEVGERVKKRGISYPNCKCALLGMGIPGIIIWEDREYLKMGDKMSHWSQRSQFALD